MKPLLSLTLPKRLVSIEEPFYLHYTDTFNMMNRFKNDTLDDLYRLLNQAEIYTDTRQVLTQALSYLSTEIL